MYLYAKQYKSKGSWDKEEEDIKYPNQLKNLEVSISERNFKSVESEYQIGYWRKFNALHNYIVKNFANGLDECQEIELSKSDIEDMLSKFKQLRESFNTCEKVEHNENGYEYYTYNNELAREILPTQSGFFFGGLKYDEYYIAALDYTIELFQMIINDSIFDEFEVVYQASW